MLGRLSRLEESLYIQTHNFPDPDAVASAYGLQQFLHLKGIDSKIIYDGMIQRTALENMIVNFSIDIRHRSAYEVQPDDKIIIVDGCKHNTNVTDLPGEEIAVIDHHPLREPDDVEFVDIRPEAGSCSSIITSYFREKEVPIPPDVATVLLTGLFRDTDCMTRGISAIDVEAYEALYKRADYGKASSMVLNNITLDDLNYYEYLIKNLKREGELAFCYFREDCGQNLLGILGDFLLSLDEIKFTALFAENDQCVNISLRNESEGRSASEIMKKIVTGTGTGGGHRHMAGGVIYDRRDFDEEWMFRKLSLLISG